MIEVVILTILLWFFAMGVLNAAKGHSLRAAWCGFVMLMCAITLGAMWR